MRNAQTPSLTGEGDESDDMATKATDPRLVDPSGQHVPFISPEAKDLADYWFRLAASARGVPPRASFDPIDIPRLLPNIFLFERIAPGTFKVKLQGTSFTERGVRDITGTVHATGKATDAERPLFELFERLLDTPCGLHLIGVEQNLAGRNDLIESVGFPLADGSGAPRFIVSIIKALQIISYEDKHQIPDPTANMSLMEIRQVTEIPLDQLDKVLS